MENGWPRMTYRREEWRVFLQVWLGFVGSGLAGRLQPPRFRYGHFLGLGCVVVCRSAASSAVHSDSRAEQMAGQPCPKPQAPSPMAWRICCGSVAGARGRIQVASVWPVGKGAGESGRERAGGGQRWWGLPATSGEGEARWEVSAAKRQDGKMGKCWGREERVGGPPRCAGACRGHSAAMPLPFSCHLAATARQYRRDEWAAPRPDRGEVAAASRRLEGLVRSDAWRFAQL
jgi:hypothetical protein